ncbi:MAG: NUDIX domain-containing protein, partial [Chloroflexota bacterium]
GKQEDGESLKNCLKREINEELGVKIMVGEQLGVFQHAYTHFKVTLHAFESKLVNGDLSLNVHQAVEWANVESLGEFPMGKIDRQISQLLAARGN